MSLDILTKQECDKKEFIMFCADIGKDKCPMTCIYSKGVKSTREELQKITSSLQYPN